MASKSLLFQPDRPSVPPRTFRQPPATLYLEFRAQLVGASRETVNKALADFAARGWLTLSAKSVLIIDAERLAKRAH